MMIQLLGQHYANKQWGLFYNPNGLSTITYPIALSSKPWAIITTEGDPAGWNTSNGIAIAGGGSQLVALNGMTQSFALPLTISYAMAAVMTMRSGDFSGFVACPYWTECTTDTIMITPDYETQQGYTGTGKSNVPWILENVSFMRLYRTSTLKLDFMPGNWGCMRLTQMKEKFYMQ